MKVQTAILLLCFLSGVFLSVVHAKPSPALMRELIALEKYLEKKEGSEGVDGQNENPGETPTGEEFKNEVESLLKQNMGHNDVDQKLGPVQENKPTENGNDKPKNENNNNGGGETNTAEGSGGGGEETPHAGDKETPAGQEVVVPPAKPEESVSPENPEEGSGPGEEAPHQEESSTASGVEGEGEKPQEGNRPSPSEGQVEKGRDQIFEVLDDLTRKIKDALDKLSTLGEDFRKQFQNDEHKLKELEDKDAQTKEKTKEKWAQLKTDLEALKSAIAFDETPSVGKKSVRENAPARRSHISDTEFLNMLHSLLTYS